jgi:hypothetical protein
MRVVLFGYRVQMTTPHRGGALTQSADFTVAGSGCQGGIVRSALNLAVAFMACADWQAV